MGSDNYDTISNVLSTGTIVAIVIGAIIGLATCIGFIVIVICIIKNCNQRRDPRGQGIVLQPTYPYPHSWTTQYPPNTTSVANYPPSYESLPPPYTASAPDPMKSQYT